MMRLNSKKLFGKFTEISSCFIVVFLRDSETLNFSSDFGNFTQKFTQEILSELCCILINIINLTVYQI